MGSKEDTSDEITYPLGAVARLTGLSPDVLRAWERRYDVVEPLRTPGGTRRYRASDVERLRLVKAVVDAGHRIGQVAGLDSAELERRVERRTTAKGSVDEAVRAIDRLDAAEVERLTALQLAALGPVSFAREFAVPFLREIGSRWESGHTCVASEHLASGILRSLLGASLRPSVMSASAPPILFCTPPRERHELGLLIAALVAAGAGGNPLYLGPDLPLDEIAQAATRVNAGAVALGIVALQPDEAATAVRSLREQLGPEIELWIGGPGGADLELPPRADRIGSIDLLEDRVPLVALRR